MSEVNVLSLSYGKDSLATIAACEQLGIPIHRIIHAEVWATDEIPADLPPMVEFKKKADAIIKERWGLEVEHICAMTTPDKKYGLFSRCHSDGRGKQTYESLFYTKLGRGKFVGTIKGFPMVKKGWCRHLKPQGETDVRRYLLSSYQEPSQERERDGTASRSREVPGARENSNNNRRRREETLFKHAPTTGGRNKYCCKSVGHSG